MQIEEKPAFSTPFEWIGGEDKVRALVERFYVPGSDQKHSIFPFACHPQI